MAIAFIKRVVSVVLGGEAVRIDHETASADFKQKFDRTLNCVGATNPTPVTLYNASTDPVPSHLTIQADPDNLQATAKPIEVEITVGAVVMVFRLDRTGCLQFSGTTAGGAAFGGSAAAGSISLIRARNIPGTTATTDDVRVRCLGLLA